MNSRLKRRCVSERRAGGGEVALLLHGAGAGRAGGDPQARWRWAPTGRCSISDPALHGSDMWATGHVLAQALKKLTYDLVLVGSQSSDAGGGMVYGIIAELGLPQVTWINEIRWRTARCAASASATSAST